MRSILRAVFVMVALGLCMQEVSADCGQCDQDKNQCYATVEWDYLFCEYGCNYYDYGCSVDCRATYLMGFDYCDNQYDYCTMTCGSGGGDNGGNCNGGHQTTCGVQCGDGSWSSIACNPNEAASCTCSGEPLQANPSCTPVC